MMKKKPPLALSVANKFSFLITSISTYSHFFLIASCPFPSPPLITLYILSCIWNFCSVVLQLFCAWIPLAQVSVSMISLFYLLLHLCLIQHFVFNVFLGSFLALKIFLQMGFVYIDLNRFWILCKYSIALFDASAHLSKIWNRVLEFTACCWPHCNLKICFLFLRFYPVAFGAQNCKLPPSNGCY